MSEDFVYSTEKGDLRKKKRKVKNKASSLPPGIKNDEIVRIQKESKGRCGKTVCVIYGIPLSGIELALLAKKLKQKCGCGGSVKGNTVIIQGDNTSLLCSLLQKEGYTVKCVGG